MIINHLSGNNHANTPNFHFMVTELMKRKIGPKMTYTT